MTVNGPLECSSLTSWHDHSFHNELLRRGTGTARLPLATGPPCPAAPPLPSAFAAAVFGAGAGGTEAGFDGAGISCSLTTPKSLVLALDRVPRTSPRIFSGGIWGAFFVELLGPRTNFMNGCWGAMQEHGRASWLTGVVLACHLCACGSDVTPVASGPETDFFLRSMLGPYSARLRAMNIQRGRPTTFMMADLEARAQEDPAPAPAPGPEHGVGTVVPQEGEDTLAEPHHNPVAGLKVTTGKSHEDETEAGSFRDVGPSEAPSATLQTLKPTADSAREQRVSASQAELHEGYEIADDRPMREIGMSDLQQHAELRRFATFSEEQLQPFEVPALRWLANATITPLLKTVTEALDNAIQNLANQPEVLVWSLQPGDHLRVKGVAGFMALTHHAIYLGNGRIMHFTGGVTDKANATVRIDTLARLHKFTQSIGHTACRIEVIPHPPNALPRDKIIERAISREGEVGYNLFSKNCEHVVLWCINGEEQSLQVFSLRVSLCFHMEPYSAVPTLTEASVCSRWIVSQVTHLVSALRF